MSAWIWLIIAIAAEVMGTTCLKLSEGFTRWIPSILVVLGYGFAFYGMSQSLKSIPISMVYAIWSGAGIAIITLLGYQFFDESMSWLKITSLGLIILGIAGLRLSMKGLA